MVTIDDLIADGFKEFSADRIFTLADRAFQRWERDADGNRLYAVTAYCYDRTYYPTYKDGDQPWGIEFDFQFYLDPKQEEGFVNVKIVPWELTLADVLLKAYELWDTCGRVKYEREYADA